MHRATALLPCMHMVCAGCASKSLARSDRCPSCRAEVTGVGNSAQMKGVVEAFFAARPSRKRTAEELSRLDKDEEKLAGRVDRIVRQRRIRERPLSILGAVLEGDVGAVLGLLADGAGVNDSDEPDGPLLHIAADAEDLEMVRAQP